MNKADLINAVAASGLTKVKSNEVIDIILNSIKDELTECGKVTLVGFGTFTTAERKARTGRNPKTGDPIEIPSKSVVKFKPGSSFSKSVNGEVEATDEVSDEVSE